MSEINILKKKALIATCRSNIANYEVTIFDRMADIKRLQANVDQMQELIKEHESDINTMEGEL